jgi:thymidylate kinase
MKKTKLLIFEGLDKVGKSTLIQEVHKLTDYKYLTIDRFAATAFAYGELYKRKIDYDMYVQTMHDLAIAFDVKVIFVFAKKNIWWDRMKSAGETSLSFDQYESLMSFFKKFFARVTSKAGSSIEIIRVDTTSETPSGSARGILNAIGEKL